MSGDEEMDVEIEGPGAAFPGKINFLISVRYSAHCTVNIMQPCSSLYEVIVERIGIGGQVDGLMQSTAAAHTHVQASAFY